jgi:hypothetical protein
MSEPDRSVQVLTGTAAGGLRWAVHVSGDQADLSTMLRVHAGNELVVPGSGFGGPALPAGSVMTEWRGRTDRAHVELPYFVMARTDPSVDRVVATTDRGAEIDLILSDPVAEFGLRFAAAALPPGHAPASIRAERGGAVLATRPQPMPPWRPGPPG